MRTVVLVPIHLDALYVKQGRRVAEPGADFSRLPYFDGTRDVNSSIAWLSEAVVTQPFQDRHFFLEKGIHLHWAFPAALTRGADGGGFPALPDRWLITQGRERGGRRQIESQWIVESNYLFPEDDSSQDPKHRSIAYPFWSEQDAQATQQRPFRRMGRAIPLKQWLQQDRSRNDYLNPPPSAVGYGEPSFAAFYPNCHSVFGFYDPRFAAGMPDGLYYQVIGWYDDGRHDYLQILLQQARAGRSQDETGKDLMSKVLRDKLDWTVGNDPPADALLACCGQLDFRPDKEQEPVWTPQLADPKVNFGATLSEALSCFIASELGREESQDQRPFDAIKAEIEDQLEAAMLAPQLDYRKLDLAAKFAEARHAGGFVGVHAGFHWSVRPQSAASAATGNDEVQPVALWPDVASSLAELNTLQRAYNAACDEIDAMRRQLYADWYKYMLSVYPPENDEADYPPIAQIRYYIEHQSLPALEKKLAQTGQLEFDSQSAMPVRASGAPHTIAIRIQRAVLGLIQQLAEHHDTNPQSHYVLQPIADPRYWRPTEPVVLLTGEMVDTEDWHARSAELDKDNKLICHTLDIGRETLGEVVERLAQDLDASGKLKPVIWSEQPWHPFMLHWEVELTPSKHLGNLTTSGRNYAPEFIRRNYTLKRNAPDLTPKIDEPALAQGAYLYSGASLLTPQAIDLYVERLKDYLDKLDQRERRGELGRTALTKATRDRLHNAMDQLKAQRFLCLAQSLSGFNDALLMHKQTLQLPIDDPIGFADQRRFAARVRAAVGDQIFSAPQPYDDFSPIRSGELKIKRLRLIGTFGRIKDFDCTECGSANAMPAKTRDRYASIVLPPRLVQPARLQFRWLAAQDGQMETNAHPDSSPICGWALANTLDSSLFFYDAEGKALGYLQRDASRFVRWRSAPGLQPAVVQLEQIGNPHLRRLIGFLLAASPAFFDQLLTDLVNAQMLIEPEQTADALLLGRPLALVRASLSLELQGPSATHQGWNEFRTSLTQHRPIDDQFTAVKFPIRLGEQDQLNDGLTVYWLEDEQGGYQDNAYVIPVYDPATAPGSALKCDFLYQSVNDVPLTVGMLIDPRGLVHASSGILPVKAIQIPPHQYAAALQHIETMLLSAPVLVDQRADASRPIGLPVSDAPGITWSWIDKQGQDWTSVPISAGGLYTPFTATPELREGWLKLTPHPTDDEKTQGAEQP
ncbi:hypothetical protein [Methylomonas rhizoryzae]|uniref:hypothetical protein n=1 Tax=Methylomonas rhizoryzae TaxID=2608981 RepID=UPI001232DBC8|nr:hypothetical protein [Methylomonas rhizoryzae]